MESTIRYWLLFEKSDETRISKGIDGYKDKTGELYHYDSLVPNHTRIKVNDLIVLRKENEILGIGKITEIIKKDDTKIHRRCPKCDSTDIRVRTSKLPIFKCGKCAKEFSEPDETIVEVTAYTATIEGFTRLNSPPTVREVKVCAASGDGASSQLSILELDGLKVRNLFEGIEVAPNPASSQLATGQGFGLSQEERKAVELLAMRITTKLYEDQGWTVVDKSSSHPFDLYATKGTERRYIEVKGTTGDGISVILTHGEVAHARSFRKESVLVVVSNIKLDKADDRWTATGGQICIHHDPWDIKDSCLQATQFRYLTQE